MGKKQRQNGRHRRGKRERSRSGGADKAGQGTTDRSPLGGLSSRLLLTRLVKEGQVWQVFVATTAGDRGPAEVRLEFERNDPDGDPIRHSRPLSGPLLEALHSGESLSRGDLERELQRAIADTTPGGSTPDAA